MEHYCDFNRSVLKRSMCDDLNLFEHEAVELLTLFYLASLIDRRLAATLYALWIEINAINRWIDI